MKDHKFSIEAIARSLKLSDADQFKKECAPLCRDKGEDIKRANSNFIIMITDSTEEFCKLRLGTPFVTSSGTFGWLDKLGDSYPNSVNPYEEIKGLRVVAFRKY